MKTIIQPHGKVNKLLPSFRAPSGRLHWFRYCVECPTDDGILLLHGITGQLIYLTNTEYAQAMHNPDLCSRLVQLHFLFGEDVDDKQLTDRTRKYLTLLSPKTICRFTIMTTMDCNAHCFYCYERGRAKNTMDSKTAVRISEYIMEQSDNRKLHINWFGGEPLMNPKVIRIICENLRKQQREFTSVLVTNGYLIDDKLISEAKSEWNLKKVQITLDGTRDVYNKVKAFSDPVDDPFERVIHNIRLLLEADISVAVRLNIEEYNSSDIMLLIDFLSESIPKSDFFSVYPALLFDGSLGEHSVSPLPERYDIYGKIRDKLKCCHFLPSLDLQKCFKINNCMADNNQALVITPDGRIGKCEHFSDSELIGSIYETGFDQKIVESFQERYYIPEQCDDCNLYAICNRLRKCPDRKGCTIQDRKLEWSRYKDAMYQEYRKDIMEDETDGRHFV